MVIILCIFIYSFNMAVRSKLIVLWFAQSQSDNKRSEETVISIYPLVHVCYLLIMIVSTSLTLKLDFNV